jgi:hypothetical protein
VQEQEQSPKKSKTMPVTTRNKAASGRKPPPPPPKPTNPAAKPTAFASVGGKPKANIPNVPTGFPNQDPNQDWKDYASELLWKLDEKQAFIDSNAFGKMTKKEREATNNDGVKSLVQNTMVHVWRTTKFFNSEGELMETTNTVLDMTKLTGFDISMARDRVEGQAIAEKRALWMKNYKEIVRMELNNKRSYVMVNDLRKCFRDLFFRLNDLPFAFL